MASTTLEANGTSFVATLWLSNNSTYSILTILGVATLTYVVRFIQYRQSYRTLAPNIPAPPFSILFGNLGAMVSIYSRIPSNADPHNVFTMMQQKWNLKGMWYLDTWPASAVRQIIIADPVLAAQVTQVNSLPKHSTIKKFVGHIVGPTSILLTEGSLWKKTRQLFNPGFSLTHLLTLVPIIVDDAAVYCKIIGEQAESGEVRPIEEALAFLTIDVMGHVVLDYDLNAQTSKNELVEAFRSQIDWTPSVLSTNPFSGLNPVRPFMHRYYERKMNNYLEKILDHRYASFKPDSGMASHKPAIDLALDEYVLQQKETKLATSTQGPNKAFKALAIDQMKTFIFAGHDTTSSTIAYAYLLLSQNPRPLAKARAELDEVFGMDVAQTGNLIKQNPSLTNNLHFLLGVIKESLRLFPPALVVREGKGTLGYEGNSYDMNGFMVLVSSHTMHRNPDWFPSPEEFIPERWIPAPDNFQDIPKDVFRPFSKGPRDCIGQQLAILEIKIILAMTLREFDFEEGYETWDRKLGREKPGDILGGRRGMFGQRAYQHVIASAKPADGLPGRFIRRKHAA